MGWCPSCSVTKQCVGLMSCSTVSAWPRVTASQSQRLQMSLSDSRRHSVGIPTCLSGTFCQEPPGAAHIEAGQVSCATLSLQLCVVGWLCCWDLRLLPELANQWLPHSVSAAALSALMPPSIAALISQTCCYEMTWEQKLAEPRAVYCPRWYVRTCEGMRKECTFGMSVNDASWDDGIKYIEEKTEKNEKKCFFSLTSPPFRLI